MKHKTGSGTFWKDVHILETLRGGGIFLIVKILGSFGAYLFAWYISREYGAEGNGILAFTLTASVLLGAFFNLGLNTYVVKIISSFRSQNNEGGLQSFYRKALTTVALVSLVGSGLLLTASYLIPDGDLATDFFLISLMTLPVSMLLFISNTYKAHKKILGFSLLQNNIVQVFALLVLLFPFWGRLSVTEPVWAFIITTVVMCVLGLVILPVKRPPAIPTTEKPFGFHLRESLPMLAGGMAFIILNLSDRLMLRFLDTTAQLGIYDIALRLSNLTLLGILSLNAIAEPKFAELFAQNDQTHLGRFTRRMTFLGIAISIPVIGALGLFPNFWMGLFGNGNDFLSGVSTLYILLIGQVVSVVCGAVLVLLNMTGHQRSVQTILFTAALLNIVLNLILIPKMGIEGAAWATIIGTLLWNIWGVWTVRQKLGFWMWGSVVE